MVNLTNFLSRWRLYKFKLSRPHKLRQGHKFVRNQQYLRISNIYHGRPRNCQGLSKRRVKRQLSVNTLSRQSRHKALIKLFYDRIDGALYEYGITQEEFMFGLRKSNILLDRKSLSLLAIYEPLSFQSMVRLSQNISHEAGVKNALYQPPEGVFTRHML